MPVFIASISPKKKWEWYDQPEKFQFLNVTSLQKKNNEYRTLCPSTPIINKYKGFYCFENYWQGIKYYDNMTTFEFEQNNQRWKSLNYSVRTDEYSKRDTYLYSIRDNVKYDYIMARKEIYVPEYYSLIKDNKLLLKTLQYTSFKNIIVVDFDGPKSNNINECKQVNRELLIEKINDIKYPFGHGYIVAGFLANIHPKEYCI